MTKNLQFRLTMRGRNGYLRRLLYRPHESQLVWEDNAEPASLNAIGMAYEDHERAWGTAFPMSPENPARKSRAVRTLKIQMGLKCNFSCAYCNQASQGGAAAGNVADAQVFLDKLPDWLQADPDNLRIEFWGGEPFVYWKALKILGEGLRERFPKARFNIITNGSLLDEEKINWLDELGFGVSISHDGPAHKATRGPDPLEMPKTRQAIRSLYDRLFPKGKIGFGCVLTKDNRSLVAVREYIGEKLGIPARNIPLSTEEILLPYDQGGMALSPSTPDEHGQFLTDVFWEAVRGGSMPVGAVRGKCEDFYRSIARGRPARTLGQKCGMDKPEHLAVDLMGNVLTCQNTSASKGHGIGSVEAFDDIRLTTSRHWSTRPECNSCTVVQLCKGSCMFLEGDLWDQACDNSYTWNLSMLAVALYWLTRLVLVEIEGPPRRPGLPKSMPVISLADLQDDVGVPDA
tara:strand:+ start:43367 stop:44743 length:1377 start_codon:yes stop_codon:yes gene_type:complete